jgi:hypothetical protein
MLSKLNRGGGRQKPGKNAASVVVRRTKSALPGGLQKASERVPKRFPGLLSGRTSASRGPDSIRPECPDAFRRAGQPDRRQHQRIRIPHLFNDLCPKLLILARGACFAKGPLRDYQHGGAAPPIIRSLPLSYSSVICCFLRRFACLASHLGLCIAFEDGVGKPLAVVSSSDPANTNESEVS